MMNIIFIFSVFSIFFLYFFWGRAKVLDVLQVEDIKDEKDEKTIEPVGAALARSSAAAPTSEKNHTPTSHGAWQSTCSRVSLKGDTGIQIYSRYITDI